MQTSRSRSAFELREGAHCGRTCGLRVGEVTAAARFMRADGRIYSKGPLHLTRFRNLNAFADIISIEFRKLLSVGYYSLWRPLPFTTQFTGVDSHVFRTGNSAIRRDGWLYERARSHVIGFRQAFDSFDYRCMPMPIGGALY